MIALSTSSLLIGLNLATPSGPVHAATSADGDQSSHSIKQQQSTWIPGTCNVLLAARTRPTPFAEEQKTCGNRARAARLAVHNPIVHLICTICRRRHNTEQSTEHSTALLAESTKHQEQQSFSAITKHMPGWQRKPRSGCKTDPNHSH
jgi:hypothetical protein